VASSSCHPAVIGGRPHLAEAPEWLTTDAARAAYARFAGKAPAAPRRMVELLPSRATCGERSPISHPVKFYEKGDKPLEIVTTRQWYIRNGGRDPSSATLVARRELTWHPSTCGTATTTGSTASTATG
jgi:valyl-tRNA synthetase